MHLFHLGIFLCIVFSTVVKAPPPPLVASHVTHADLTARKNNISNHLSILRKGTVSLHALTGAALVAQSAHSYMQGRMGSQDAMMSCAHGVIHTAVAIAHICGITRELRRNVERIDRPSPSLTRADTAAYHPNLRINVNDLEVNRPQPIRHHRLAK